MRKIFYFIFLDTSATDTDPEEPANALASLGKKAVQVKPKAAKQRRITKSASREKGMFKTAKLSRPSQHKKDKKIKVIKKEKENMKDASKKQRVSRLLTEILIELSCRTCQVLIALCAI